MLICHFDAIYLSYASYSLLSVTDNIDNTVRSTEYDILHSRCTEYDLLYSITVLENSVTLYSNETGHLSVYDVSYNNMNCAIAEYLLLLNALIIRIKPCVNGFGCRINPFLCFIVSILQ